MVVVSFGVLLRSKFEARDAVGIVALQVDDGPLPVMASDPLEVARFATMLVHEAQGEGRVPELTVRVKGLCVESRTVALVVVDGRRVCGDVVLPVGVFEPVLGESMVPFLVRVVGRVLGVFPAVGSGLLAA